MATEYKQIPIRLTPEQHIWLEDQALANRRAGNKDVGSISKIVRQAVDEYRAKIEKELIIIANKMEKGGD